MEPRAALQPRRKRVWPRCVRKFVRFQLVENPTSTQFPTKFFRISATAKRSKTMQPQFTAAGCGGQSPLRHGHQFECRYPKVDRRSKLEPSPVCYTVELIGERNLTRFRGLELLQMSVSKPKIYRILVYVVLYQHHFQSSRKGTSVTTASCVFQTQSDLGTSGDVIGKRRLRERRRRRRPRNFKSLHCRMTNASSLRLVVARLLSKKWGGIKPG